MSNLRVSPHELRGAAVNVDIIGQALKAHPVHRLTAGDVGHAGVATALNDFRDAWAGELRLRERGTSDAEQVLMAAAADTERVDVLLANAASRIVNA